jgi:RHS repeat-associated protein
MGYWYQDSVNSSFSHTATYTYDGVNRLTNAVATGSSTYNLTFSYTQDGSNGRYGNMSCVTNAQTVGPCTNLSFNAADNHITTSGYTYDAAGNQTKDSSNLSTHTYQWDAEGRVASVDGGSTWSFTYNALGYRVQWAYTGGADQHLFDPAGNWLGVAGSYSLVRFGSRHMLAYLSTDTVFNHVNQLAATTMGTNNSGTAVEDVLFYPWGDQWQSSASGYSWAMPYRDLKTTTDITTARFSSPNFGRWFSPDPIGVKAVKLDDPQTWNMYAYVRNNPTTLTDPNGEDWATAWQDVKAALGTAYTRLTIGVGFGGKFNAGPLSGTSEYAWKANLRVSMTERKISLTNQSQAGLTFGPAGSGGNAGLGASVENTVASYNGGTGQFGGPEPPHAELTTLSGTEHYGTDPSSNEVGLSYEGGYIPLWGAEIGLTKQGWSLLGDALQEIKDTYTLPPPPPTPAPPLPPCTATDLTNCGTPGPGLNLVTGWHN